MPNYNYSPDTYDPNVVNTIIQTGRQRGLDDDHIVTALATGIVESSLRNLDHGHGSSVGWRQEVEKYYGSKQRRMDVQGATNRFYDELSGTPRESSLGMWAQAVQRSAHPDRYDKALPAARQVLQEWGGGKASPAQNQPQNQGGEFQAAAGDVEPITGSDGMQLPVRPETRDMWRNILQAMSNRVAGRPVDDGIGPEGIPIGEGAADPEASLRELYSRYGGQGLPGQPGQQGQQAAPHPPFENQEDAAESASGFEGELSPQEAERLYQEARAGGHGWGGHQNGRIPGSAMTELPGGHKLENSAAHKWNQMVAAARAEGVNISLTDSYRSYEGQVDVRRRKGHKVATADPGTSIHGWGRAVDVGAGRDWIQRNGHRWGWVWPKWAQTPGTKAYEPWHFEFVGG